MEKKGVEPVILDVSGSSSYTDYILIVSGRSDRQVSAVAEAIEDELREAGRKPMGVEGKRDGHWALLDYGELVVHVFYHPIREHYDLEGLWVDATRVHLDIPPDSRLSAVESYGV